jgi:hypothetical protein
MLRKWTKEEITYLRENYLTLGAEDAAKGLNRTVSAIHTKIREIGGGRNSVEWSDAALDYLRQNYQTTKLEDLAICLGRTEHAINRRASMLGLQKYIDPYQFFESWTEESAYTIGFFAADGNVDKRGPESLRINFSQKEPDIIYALRDAIGTGKIIRKSRGTYELYIQSVKIYQRLCAIFSQDVCRKSLTLKWPSIPDEYAKHFTRGAMDGDGALMKKKDGTWEISYSTGSGDFAKGLEKEVFRLTGIKMHVGYSRSHLYAIRCAGIKAVCLASWLYKDCKIALDRKEWIAREMYNTLGGVAYSDGITPKMHEMFPDILNTYRIVG